LSVRVELLSAAGSGASVDAFRWIAGFTGDAGDGLTLPAATPV
jgi:hypothetical protein